MANSSELLAPDALARVVAERPFAAWLGLTVTAVEDGAAQLALDWRDEMAGADGHAEQAVLGALVDAAAAAAIAVRLGARVPTSDLRIDYHQPAAAGALTARGGIVRLGGTFAVAEAEVRDADGALVASGRGTYFTGALRGR